MSPLTGKAGVLASGDESAAQVVAVCISPGGIPKQSVATADVGPDGLVGDAHDHDKHRRLHRAVLIQDLELLEQIRDEGFPVDPGTMGENLTVRGLNVQGLNPGDKLCFEDGPILELTEPRKPCFVLDKIDPTIKDAIVGRCGFLAKVIRTGRFASGQRITIEHQPG